MARTKLPAALQKGNTWSKEDLDKMDRLEREMIGSDDAIEEVPDHLDEYAKIYYQYIIENLKTSKIPLSNLDKPTIEMVADCLSKVYQCQIAIKEQGLTVEKTERNGAVNYVANPHIKIMHDYQAKFIQMSSQLGMTPSSRSSLASMQVESKVEEQDEVMQLIKSLKD